MKGKDAERKVELNREKIQVRTKSGRERERARESQIKKIGNNESRQKQYIGLSYAVETGEIHLLISSTN